MKKILKWLTIVAAILGSIIAGALLCQFFWIVVQIANIIIWLMR